MQYPVTATQWHPEKNVFEWATHLHVPHSYEAVSHSSISFDANTVAHLKHLHIVEKRSYCPQMFLSLDFQRRGDVSH